MNKARYKYIFNRKNSLNSEGKAPVELRMTLNRKIVYFTTGIFLQPNQWNEKKLETNSNLNNYKQTNSFLTNFKLKIEEYEMSCIIQNKEFTLEMAKEFINNGNKVEPEKSFFDFCYSELDNDNSVSKATKIQHKVTLHALEEIAPNCSFDNITFDLIQRYDYHIRNKVGVNSQNTIHKYHKFLKRYINLAIKKDFMQKSPYDNFKVKKSPTSRTSLEMFELEMIENFQPDNNILNIVSDIEEVRDFFVFACYTGLRYSDLRQLNSDNFTQSDKGLVLELKSQIKTEKPLYLPLSILFSGKPEKIIKPYLVRVGKIVRRDDKYLNKALKYIALSCGIKKNLTLHVARHTFGTMLATITGDPFVIQDLMSHSDIKTSMNYIHLSRERKNETLKKIDWEK